MNNYQQIRKLTIIVNKQLAQAVECTLAEAGIKNLYVEAGRTSYLKENKGLAMALGFTNLGNDPIEIITIFIANEVEDDIVNYIFERFDFKIPGRGTIISNDISLIKAHPLCLHNTDIHVSNSEQAVLLHELKGICCIVQRGEGDKISRVSLQSGASVPVTTYGEGSGVRDKLGLLRITIPAEKELINLIMSEYDIDTVMELFITEGKLDEPGRGIAYIYPVKHGIVNTKIASGKTGQLASIEQIVSAIDSVKEGMEWRKSRFDSQTAKQRVFLTDLVELNLICNEGYGSCLASSAMEHGAPGSTICKIKYRSFSTDEDKIPVVREICKMIVASPNIPSIITAIENAGGFADEMHGMLYSLPVTKAFTYIAR